MDLVRRTASGGLLMSVANVGSQGILLLSTLVLARILTPAHFGLLAMILPILGFVTMIQQLGTSAATIQKKALTTEESSVIFWLNLGMASLAWAAITGASGLIARFYHQPALTGMVVAMAGLILLSGVSAQPRAMLVRAMRFRTLAAIEVGALVAAGSLGIGAALYGLNAWALVIMNLTGPAVQALAYWIATGFRPGWPRWVATAKSLVRFGAELTAFRLLKFLVRNLDLILMGRVWGAEATGFYSRAMSLALNPLICVNSPLNPVAVPALSRLQDDLPRLGRAYLRMVRGVTAITFPTACCLFVLAREVTSLVLGDQWGPAVPILRIMCVVSLFEAAQRSIEWVFVSTGRTDSYLRWGLVSVPVICLAYVLGLPWGGIGVASGFAISSTLLYIPGVWWALRLAGRRPVDAATHLGPTLATALGAGVAAWCFLRFVVPPGASDILRVCVGTVLYVVVYAGLARVLAPALLADVKEIGRRLRQPELNASPGETDDEWLPAAPTPPATSPRQAPDEEVP